MNKAFDSGGNGIGDPESFINLMDKVEDYQQAKLAQYVIQRNLTIRLLESAMKRNNGGNYPREDVIHDIIFPMKTTSDDWAFEKNNLWLIDERWVFHEYLQSDKDMKSVPGIENGSRRRPDLLIFTSPTDKDSPAYGSIVLVEFKQAGRASYGSDDDPIRQVYNYISEIREKAFKDSDGRPVSLRENAPAYCYIICDITNKIERFAKDAQLLPSPDEGGYFGYNSNHTAYVEVISLDKLLSDSKKRNSAFFDRLNIPRP